MTLLTTDEYRAFGNVGAAALVDTALQMLLDAAEDEIDRYAGPIAPVTDFITAGGHLIVTSRRIDSITSITETSWTTPSDVTTLAADDYLEWPGGYVIERVPGGTRSRFRWWGRVAVTYTAADDVDLRKIVQKELTDLMISYAPGVTQEQVGAWSRTLASNSVWNAAEERAAILSRLVEPGRMVVV